jgi:predicted nucleic acid-binding protein
VRTLLATNVIVRHLTQDPPDLGQAATRYLAKAEALVLTDVVAAETVYVLQSYYRAPREQVAGALRALLAMRSVEADSERVLLRAADLFEHEAMDFADAHLVACAESRGIDRIASFDKGIGKAKTVERIDPSRSA